MLWTQVQSCWGGGGMLNISRLYSNAAKIWPEQVFSDNVNTKLLAPVHGDSGGVRGGAFMKLMRQVLWRCYDSCCDLRFNKRN